MDKRQNRRRGRPYDDVDQHSRLVEPPTRSRARDAADLRSRPEAAERSQPGRQSWFRRHRVASVLLFAALLAVAAGGVYFGRAILDPSSVLANRPGDSQGYRFPKDVVNILILGTDADAGRVKAGMNARTDCVMVASIDTKTKLVSLVSIPRDTYVDIYDENNRVVDQNRVNSAFAYGGGLKQNGAAYAVNTVEQFLGGAVPIDHFVLFDMDLVTRLVDAVSGVTVDVDISVDVDNIHLRPGVQKLGGNAALVYARDRHNTPGGDFGRVGHQQQVMIALLKQLQNKGNIVKSIPALYASLGKNVSTDSGLGAQQVTALAWIAKDVSASGVKQYTITGSSLSINGASIVVADQAVKQKVIKEVFGVDYKIRADETYDHLKSQVTKVLNAGKGVVNAAQSLLADNKPYYTADEAKPLKDAIAEWQVAFKRNDSDGMEAAQQDVQTECDILKKMIDKRKAEAVSTPTPTPRPSDTPKPSDKPQPSDTPMPAETTAPPATPAAST